MGRGRRRAPHVNGGAFIVPGTGRNLQTSLFKEGTCVWKSEFIFKTSANLRGSRSQQEECAWWGELSPGGVRTPPGCQCPLPSGQGPAPACGPGGPGGPGGLWPCTDRNHGGTFSPDHRSFPVAPGGGVASAPRLSLHPGFQTV